MPRSSSRKSNKKRSRSDHWKELPRDSKGRWMKRGSKKKKKQKKPKQKRSPSLKKSRELKPKPTNAEDAKEILRDIQEEFNQHCPRCGGNMKKQSIRCGPERLVKVNKCKICNYWVPLKSATA